MSLKVLADMTDIEWITVLFFILFNFSFSFAAPTEEPDYSENFSEPPDFVQEPELIEQLEYPNAPEESSKTIVSSSQKYLIMLENLIK